MNTTVYHVKLSFVINLLFLTLHNILSCFESIVNLTSQNTIDVCKGTDIILSDRGIITSPGYPISFHQQNQNCQRIIKVPEGKSVNIWIVDLKLGYRDSNGLCPNEYVKITDSTGEYIICGVEKSVYYKRLCSNVIYITYKTEDKVL